MSRTEPLTHRTAEEPLQPGVVDIPIPDGHDWMFYETYHELPDPAEQPSGTYVVVDAINFSTTVAWLLDRGVSSVVPLIDRDSADRFGTENPGALVGGDYAFDSGEDSLVRNSPTDCAERGFEWTDRVVGLNSINGANAVKAVRADASVVVASTVNARAVADWLEAQGEPIHFVAAGTRGEHAVEDTFGVYRVVHHLLNEDSSAADVMHLRLLDHLYANASHLNSLPDLHPDQHVVRAFDSLSTVPVRMPGAGLIETA